jgi:hypothetical protein
MQEEVVMIKKCALFCLLVLSSVFLTACASPFPRAKVTFKVVNQDGEPVKNEPAQLGFFGGKGIRGTTDENGCFTGEGETYSDYLFGVGLSENGAPNKKYYATWYQKKIANWKNVPEDGKWKPWNETIHLVVKEKVNPIAMYASNLYDFKSNIPKSNEWIGYDFEQNDWLVPYGKGKVADVEFSLAIDWYEDDYVKQQLRMRFPYPHAGVYFMKKDMVLLQFSKKERASDFKSVYHADPNYDYQNEIVFNLEAERRGNQTRTLQEKSMLLTKEEYLIFRTRTKVDEDGNLIEARYGKIYGPIEFNGVELAGNKYLKKMVRMSFYLNPNVNDTNLECKPYDSLCPGKLHIPEP